MTPTHLKFKFTGIPILVLAFLLQFCTTQKSVTKRQDSATKSQKIDSMSAEVPADTISVDKASPFVDGFARVIKDSSSFYINKKGKRTFDRIINSFQPLDSVTAARQGYVKLHKNEKKLMRLVTKDRLYGMANEQGEWILKPKYDSLSFEFKRYVEAHKNGKMTYTNSWGKRLLPLKFEDVAIMDGDYYDVKKNGKWGIYQASTAEMVIPFKYDSFDYCGGCGGSPEYFYAQKDGKWGVIDLNNKILVPFKYEHQHANMRSDEWVTAFQKNGDRVVLNISLGKEYSPPEYSSPEIIQNLLVAKKNGKYGIIDKQGNIIIPPEYGERIWVYGDYFGFTKNDKEGLLNDENEVILPAKYDRINQDEITVGDNREEVIFELKNGSKYGFYYPRDSKLLSPKFDRVKFFNADDINPYGVHPEALIEVTENDKSKLYDLNQDQIIPGKYAKFELQPHNKVILIKENYGKQGVYDLKKKKLIIPFNYKFIKVFKDESKLIKVEQAAGDYQTTAGIFDLKGKQLLPVEFADIERLDADHFLLNKKDSFYSIWNSKTRKKEKLPFAKVTKNDSTALLTVRKNSKTFLYDYKQKKLLLKTGYADIKHLQSGRFVVTQKDSANQLKYGYANPQGKLIVPLGYDKKRGAYRLNFQHERYLSLYKKDESSGRMLQGFADLEGEILVPANFQKVFPEVNAHGFLTKNGNHFGVIDPDGNEILSPKYNIVLNRALSPYKDTAEFNFPLLFGKEGSWQYINKNGKVLPVKAHSYIDFRKRR